jgi:predicted transcriptional regulator
MSPPRRPGPLSPLEHDVMGIVWQRGEATAEDVLAGLRHPLKNATVRTLLRRLEAKGFVRHTVRGRAHVYRPRVAETRAGAGALERVMRRFFGGSPSRLLVGLVDEGIVDAEALREVSRALAKRGVEGNRRAEAKDE